MRIRYLLFAIFSVSLTLTAAAVEDVTVAAAISLKESMEAVRADYQAASGDTLHFTFASSGQLAAQVQNGAEVDLFLSAAKKQVDDLKKAGKTDDSTATVFAGNELVLVVPKDSKNSIERFEQLADPAIRRIAVGEPKTVPAGEYAQQVIEHLELTDKLKQKLVLGLNVRQVLQYVQSAEVDAGIVYRSDAQQAGEQVKVVATADAQWHSPIGYWGVAISGSKHGAAAKKFLDYLKADAAQTVFKSHGFSPPTTAPSK